MAKFSVILKILLILPATAQAHFVLSYPESIKPAVDDQQNAPCGAVVPKLSEAKLSDFHTDGESVSVLTSHPQGNWLYRVTLDENAAGNWTQVFPTVQQNGPGSFCVPAITAPSHFVGHKGFLGVVSSTPHGHLFSV
jgi:hypothetical protein